MKSITVVLLIGAIASICLASSSVDTAWVRRFENLGGTFQPKALVCDQQGNVFVTGNSGDYLTIAYNSAGDTLWTRRIGGSAGIGDIPRAITVDVFGSIIASGIVNDFSQMRDIGTIKYLPNGDTSWFRIYNSAFHRDDGCIGVATDITGNVYVAGHNVTGSSSSEFLLLKYSSAGDFLWERHYTGPVQGLSDLWGLDVNSAGYAVVSGEGDGIGSFSDYVTILYDPNGDTLWVRKFDGTGLGDRPSDVAFDPQGNIVVIGASANDITIIDFVTIKYDFQGNLLWARSFDGPAHNWDLPEAIEIDQSGNIYIIGSSALSEGFPADFDIVVLKYDTDGNLQWSSYTGGSDHTWDYGADIGVDAAGNVTIVGTVENTGNGSDFQTTRYNSMGVRLWSRSYNYVPAGYEEAVALVVDEQGDVIVTGRSVGAPEGASFATIKYHQNFICGDADDNGVVDISDIVFIIQCIFACGPGEFMPPSAEVNCDSQIDISDIVYLLAYIFSGGPIPCAGGC